MEKNLAKISSGGLRLQDRGILMLDIFVDYEEGMSQGVCGLVLDSYDKSKDHRVGTSYGCELIRRVLEEFKIDDIHELKDKHCWVYKETASAHSKVLGLSALKVDNSKTKPIIYDELLEEFGGEVDND